MPGRGNEMPNKGCKFSTDYLPNEEMHAALLALSKVLLHLLEEHPIIAMYGWAAHIHDSLHWTPMDDDTRTLHHLIEDSIEQRIVIPGRSDFLFEVPEKRLEVAFCHESDIHLDGSDDELLQQFMQTAPFVHMRWHTQAEVEKMFKRDA